MEHVSPILESLASLLWPIILLWVILKFIPTLLAILKTAQSRKWSIKLGGQEITMEEAHEQDRKLIEDLQNQVIYLRGVLTNRDKHTSETDTFFASEWHEVSVGKRIAWIDDNPQNNSFEIQRLIEIGTNIVTFLSTDDFLSTDSIDDCDLIIQDMGRVEKDEYNEKAGLNLLKALQKNEIQVPVFIFTNQRSVNKYHKKALEEGASIITSSSVKLFDSIKTEFSEK